MPEAIATTTATNLVGKLLDELERVIVIRERWKELLRRGEAPVVNLLPGLALMADSIRCAKAAIAGDDVLASLRALHDLEGYTDG